ncbi:Polymeric immunoglobulin receptor [Bagarius yarrelli]|nr:Polymeric immunoglobulin receptor [Bagarius yarrelli]
MKILLIFSLALISDSCCAEPKSVSALPGQNITMIFNYPVENKRNYKYIVKLDSTNAFKVIVDTNTKLRKNRFSVSEDRRAQVASLSISNVKKVDDGVYFCGVGDKLNSYLYFSFFSETQLHVKGSTVHIIIIISVCVCLALLLTGGFAVLIYKMRHRITQDSCCAEPKNVSVFPGQNITIISNYPEKYEKYPKYFIKLDTNNSLQHVPNVFTQAEISRFFVYEDKIAKVVSMNISNVIKEDDGVYLCGVFDKQNSLLYFNAFLEFQLNFKADEAPAGITSDIVPSSDVSKDSFRTIKISVSVCSALLLIGGIALLIYVPPTACVYEEISQTKHASASNTELYMTASSPSNGADRKITTIQTPPDQNLTYTTLSFPNNPVDAAVNFNKDNSMTEYATVQHNSSLE